MYGVVTLPCGFGIRLAEHFQNQGSSYTIFSWCPSIRRWRTLWLRRVTGQYLKCTKTRWNFSDLPVVFCIMSIRSIQPGPKSCSNTLFTSVLSIFENTRGMQILGSDVGVSNDIVFITSKQDLNTSILHRMSVLSVVAFRDVLSISGTLMQPPLDLFMFLTKQFYLGFYTLDFAVRRLEVQLKM